MKLLMTQLMELLFELMLFVVGMACYSLVSIGNNVHITDVHTSFLLWITVLIYRLVFLQLPLSWLVKFVAMRKFKLFSHKVSVAINVASFLLILGIARFYSGAIEAFTQGSKILVPVLLLVATAISPLCTVRICRYQGSVKE